MCFNYGGRWDIVQAARAGHVEARFLYVRRYADGRIAAELTDADRTVARCLELTAGPEVADSAPHQAALLTVVNVVGRFALGGVTVSGNLDVPLLVLGDRSASLSAAAWADGSRVDIAMR